MLEAYGWDAEWARSFGDAADVMPARVLSVRERMSEVVSVDGVELAWNSLPPARLRVATGDWVRLTRRRYERSQPNQPHLRTARSAALRAIASVLPRRTALARRLRSRRTDENLIAANLDTVLIVAALVPPCRDIALLQYIALGVESDAQVVVVLTKSDLHPDHASERSRVAGVVTPHHRVLAVSGLTGEGTSAIQIPEGATATLIGPSGSGKSTLVNRIFGLDLQRTGAVSRSGVGRHTTTTNQLHLLRSGAMFVDTPGIHNVGSRIDSPTVEQLFSDVKDLGQDCRFANCKHTTEPDCAVLDAVATGAISSDRLDLWRRACNFQ